MSSLTISAGSEQSSESSTFTWHIGLILVLALSLRLEFVSQHLVDAFSWREASTAMMADNFPRNGWNPLWPEVSWTGDQPGYQGREFQFLTIFSALLNAIFGWSDWSGRVIAALSGTMTTYFLYRLAILLRGRLEALTAALTYAILPGAIVIDSSYLPDPTMLTIATCSAWCLAEGLASHRTAWYVAAAILCALSLLSKLPSIAVLPSAAYLVWSANRRKPILPLFRFSGVLALSMVPAALYYYWAIHLGQTYPPYHIAGHGWLWEEGFASFWRHGFFLNRLIDHATTWLWTPAFLVMALAGALFPRSYDGETKLKAPLFFYFWLAGCLLFYVVAAQEVTTNPWNLHVFNIGVTGLCAVGLLGAIRASGAVKFSKTIKIVVLAAILTLVSRESLLLMKRPYARNDHVLGERLRVLSTPGELVVTAGTTAGSPVAIYYSRRRGWIFPTPEMKPNYGKYSEDGIPAIRSLNDLVGRGASWFGILKLGRDKAEPRRHFIRHYKELLKYLNTNARIAWETDEYVIYELSTLGSPRSSQ